MKRIKAIGRWEVSEGASIMIGLRKSFAALAVALAIQLAQAGIAGAAEQATAPATGSDQLSGVIIYASDVERSIKFYTEAMGLKVIARVPATGDLAEVLLSKSGTMSGGAILILQPTKGLPERSDANRLKFGTILFMSASNTALAQRLQDAGYEASARDPLHLMTQDPDGHRIMSFQVGPPPRTAN
jgi:catechol 2,3-dioxygenase-like lactoylglutathione lyase family enzyme